jgi:serine/tyrosine/threonine adenylyltransferase
VLVLHLGYVEWVFNTDRLWVGRFVSLEIASVAQDVLVTAGRQGPSAGMPELLNRILSYLAFYHFRHIWDISGGGLDIQQEPAHARLKEMYLMLYQEVLGRTLKLCAKWQGVGFCHGVLNTDNMSMLGLTIDFGPYGWLDRCDALHYPADFMLLCLPRPCYHA